MISFRGFLQKIPVKIKCGRAYAGRFQKMEITIFAKKRVTEQGKTFYNFLTRLTKKSGEVDVLPVKFRESATSPKPEKCPMNIIVQKDDMNIQTGKYTRPDTGETIPTKTLWIIAWKEGSPYVDHSLDDYDVD